MKKLLAFALTAGLSISLFAADIFKYAPITGKVKAYTETEFSIASRFGTLYRTPSTKVMHVFDSNGKETTSSELTPKEDLYIHPPLVPRFNPLHMIASKTIGDCQYEIYESYPIIPKKQNEISMTTDVNRMTSKDLRNLFPNRRICTRASIMYEEVFKLPKCLLVGDIGISMGTAPPTEQLSRHVNEGIIAQFPIIVSHFRTYSKVVVNGSTAG